MYRKRLTIGLALLLVLMISSVFVTGILRPGKSAHAGPFPSDWTTYLHDPGHSGFNSAETAINPTTASSLKLQWSITEGSTISTQPVVANGKIYWGS